MASELKGDVSENDKSFGFQLQFSDSDLIEGNDTIWFSNSKGKEKKRKEKKEEIVKMD